MQPTSKGHVNSAWSGQGHQPQQQQQQQRPADRVGGQRASEDEEEDDDIDNLPLNRAEKTR